VTQVVSRAVGSRTSPSSVRSQARSRRVSFSLLLGLGLAVTALCLRLYRIDHESLWLDEGYTLLFSRLPLARLFTVGGAHEHPPLYYLLVHLFFRVHDSYLVPRVISAVAGSLSVFAMYALGTRLYNYVVGLVAAALLTVAPFQVWYSQDGRGYELAGLLVLLSYLAAWRALDRPSRVNWTVYVVLTDLSLYSEYTTLFVLLPQALLYLQARRAGAGRQLVRSWAAVALVFAPWAATLVLDASSISGQYWIPPPTSNSVANTLLEFLGFVTPCPSPPCTGTELGILPVSGHETIIAGLLVAAVAVAAGYAVWTRNFKLQLLATWLILPFALVLLLAIRRSLYLDRVFLDATFPLYLLLGVAAARAPRALSALAAIAPVLLIGAASTASLSSVYADTGNPDWKSAARDFQAAYRPGQAVVFNPGVLRSLVTSYLPAGWHASRERALWFNAYLDVPGWEKRYAGLNDAELRDVQLAQIAAGQRQIWLITEDYVGLNDTRRWFIAHGFQPVLSQIYSGDTRIELFDRLPPSSFGPAVLGDRGFDPGWTRNGPASTTGSLAIEQGGSTLARSFPVTSGTAYTVNVEYRGLPPASPSVSLQTYGRDGRIAGDFVDRLGGRLTSFPRTEWYSMPVNGIWLSQPFGFVAPPGAVRATIRLENRWGWTYWRHITVYRER